MSDGPRRNKEEGNPKPHELRFGICPWTTVEKPLCDSQRMSFEKTSGSTAETI
jgi:hypothetical protein